MARLVPVRHENDGFKRAARSHDAPPAREHGRIRHAARHARTSDLRPRHRTSLSIRSAERRRWVADLTGPGSGGLVVHGMDGIGKSTLAAQIAARLSRLQSGRKVSLLNGEVSAAGLAAEPAEADLIILDNFDDNLARESGRWAVRDPALAAWLAGWTGKLLITCRHSFTLDEPNGPPGMARLAFRRLGPLTRAGAAELNTSLPAIRRLGDAERDHVWRLTAGHPLAMEYLNLLLARGERYPDVAGRIEAAIEARAGQTLPRTEPTELPEATAEMIANAAGDQMFGELFDRLGAGARSLLVRLSVFRLPVPAEVLAARPGPIAECDAAGLLCVGSDPKSRELSVHRWTAGQLHRRLAGANLGAQVAAAHRQAAGYWLCRAGAAAQAQRAELEASHHERRAAELARVAGPPAVGASQRRRVVVAALAGLSVLLALQAGREMSLPPPGPVGEAARTASSAPVTAATVARDQAAAWVARQAGSGAVLACDPAMCAALAQHGVAAGNLLVLGPGAGDPLGSDLVLGTAAVRGIFGGRLAGVYAPEVLASFGTGAGRIDIRIVGPDGAASYRTELAADVRARRGAGAQLLRDPRIAITPSARTELAAGQVDARLLIILAALTASAPVQVTGFGDRGPCASASLPLRTAVIAAPAATARRMLAFARAQRSPYLPAHTDLRPGRGGQWVLTVEFAAPAPLGLLADQ